MLRSIFSGVILVLIQFNVSAQEIKHVKSIENQYAADLGNGTYLNPILRGNYADPSIVRDGEDYYMTHSSFDNLPGLLIWHSKDLVNWEPIGNALNEYVGGSVWAPDIIKYKGLFYIYFPANGTNWVVTAKNPSGPWTKPVDLKVGGIDPGHIATPEGKRYLYVDNGRMLPLSDDGLSVAGQLEKVYEGWQFPKDWIVECFCLESPKLTYRKGYYYLTTAQGGTAGPPTSHMAVSARSKTPFGPWENSPYNPIIHNVDRNSKWVSTGHGTLVDSKDGEWWIVYHGYENNNRTIGRQTLLLPIEWTKDGWMKVPDQISADKPIKKPIGAAVMHGIKLDDNFEGPKLGAQWNAIKGENKSNYLVGNGALTIKANGTSPFNTQPLTVMPANNSYQINVCVKPGSATGHGGLLLYFNPQYYAGLEFFDQAIYRLNSNGEKSKVAENIKQDYVYLRLVNDHNDLLYHYSLDGKTWTHIDFVSEMSGYHNNALSGWGYLRPGIFATGSGEVKFMNFQYEGMDY